jgi:hypothetical protein
MGRGGNSNQEVTADLRSSSLRGRGTKQANNFLYGSPPKLDSDIEATVIGKQYIEDGLTFILEPMSVVPGEKDCHTFAVINDLESLKTKSKLSYALGEDIYSDKIYQQLHPENTEQEEKLNTLLNRRTPNRFFNFILSTQEKAYIGDDQYAIESALKELDREISPQHKQAKKHLSEIISLACVAFEEQIADSILKADIIELEECFPSASDPYLEFGKKLTDDALSKLREPAQKVIIDRHSASKRLRTLTYLQEEDYALLDREISYQVIDKLLLKFKRNEHHPDNSTFSINKLKRKLHL